MKYLIVPTQNFSTSIEAKTVPTFSNFPLVVQKFITKYNRDIFVALDESSWIKRTTVEADSKKSLRTRVIKMLTRYSTSRAILTATLMSKSPINIIDQYQFLNPGYFDEPVFAFAEKYCLMMTLRVGRGRRIIIGQEDYLKIRRRLCSSYNRGGEDMLQFSKLGVMKDYGIAPEKCEHIINHRKYTPFMGETELMRRVANITYTVKRSDIFDVKPDYYVYNPIPRPVTISAKAKALGKNLVDVGFTDNMTLGKAPALELVIRLTDLCNGFEPIKDEIGIDPETGEPIFKTRYAPLPENPKLDELIQLLGEIDTKENQVAVICSRTNAIESAKAAIEKEGIPAVMYSGAQSHADKKLAEDSFQAGESRVFLASLKSTAFGLNCLANCNYLIYYCLDPSTEYYYQSKHRVLRGQSKYPKFAYQIFVKGSVEERMIKSLNAGEELINTTNERKMFEFS